MRHTSPFFIKPLCALLIVTLGFCPFPAHALKQQETAESTGFEELIQVFQGLAQSADLENLEESVRAAAGLEGFKLIRALDLRGLNKRVKMEPDEGRIKLLAWLRELPEQQGLIATPAVWRRAGLPPLVGIFGLRQTVLRLNGSSRIERRYGRGPGYRWEPLPLKEENFLVIGTDGQVSFVEVPPLGEDSEKAKALLALRKELPSINAKGQFVGKASSDRPMESQGSRIEYGMQIRRGDRLRLPSGELRQITRIYASPKSSGGIRLNTKKIDPLDGGLINSPISFSIPELLKLDAVHFPGSSGKMPGRELAVYRIGPQPVPDSIELRDGETLFIRIWGNGKTPAESLLYVLRLLDARTAAVLFGRFELEQFTLVENAGAPDFSTGAVLIEGNDWKQPSRMGKRRLKLDHPSFGEVLLRRHSQVGAWRFDLSKFSGSLEIFSLTSAAGMEEDALEKARKTLERAVSADLTRRPKIRDQFLRDAESALGLLLAAIPEEHPLWQRVQTLNALWESIKAGRGLVRGVRKASHQQVSAASLGGLLATFERRQASDYLRAATTDFKEELVRFQREFSRAFPVGGPTAAGLEEELWREDDPIQSFNPAADPKPGRVKAQEGEILLVALAEPDPDTQRRFAVLRVEPTQVAVLEEGAFPPGAIDPSGYTFPIDPQAWRTLAVRGAVQVGIPSLHMSVDRAPEGLEFSWLPGRTRLFEIYRLLTPEQLGLTGEPSDETKGQPASKPPWAAPYQGSLPARPVTFDEEPDEKALVQAAQGQKYSERNLGFAMTGSHNPQDWSKPGRDISLVLQALAAAQATVVRVKDSLLKGRGVWRSSGTGDLYLGARTLREADPERVRAAIALDEFAPLNAWAKEYLSQPARSAHPPGEIAANQNLKQSKPSDAPSLAAPVVVTHPARQTVEEGSAVTFQVQATGTEPVSYQWQRNGVDIPGATSSAYTLPAAALADNLSHFRVEVSNPAGSEKSRIGILTVRPALVSPVRTAQDRFPALKQQIGSWASLALRGGLPADYVVVEYDEANPGILFVGADIPAGSVRFAWIPGEIDFLVLLPDPGASGKDPVRRARRYRAAIDRTGMPGWTKRRNDAVPPLEKAVLAEAGRVDPPPGKPAVRLDRRQALALEILNGCCRVLEHSGDQADSPEKRLTRLLEKETVPAERAAANREIAEIVRELLGHAVSYRKALQILDEAALKDKKDQVPAAAVREALELLLKAFGDWFPVRVILEAHLKPLSGLHGNVSLSDTMFFLESVLQDIWQASRWTHSRDLAPSAFREVYTDAFRTALLQEARPLLAELQRRDKEPEALTSLLNQQGARIVELGRLTVLQEQAVTYSEMIEQKMEPIPTGAAVSEVPHGGGGIVLWDPQQNQLEPLPGGGGLTTVRATLVQYATLEGFKLKRLGSPSDPRGIALGASTSTGFPDIQQIFGFFLDAYQIRRNGVDRPVLLMTATPEGKVRLFRFKGEILDPTWNQAFREAAELLESDLSFWHSFMEHDVDIPAHLSSTYRPALGKALPVEDRRSQQRIALHNNAEGLAGNLRKRLGSFFGDSAVKAAAVARHRFRQELRDIQRPRESSNKYKKDLKLLALRLHKFASEVLAAPFLAKYLEPVAIEGFTDSFPEEPPLAPEEPTQPEKRPAQQPAAKPAEIPSAPTKPEPVPAQEPPPAPVIQPAAEPAQQPTEAPAAALAAAARRRQEREAQAVRNRERVSSIAQLQAQVASLPEADRDRILSEPYPPSAQKLAEVLRYDQRFERHYQDEEIGSLADAFVEGFLQGRPPQKKLGLLQKRVHGRLGASRSSREDSQFFSALLRLIHLAAGLEEIERLLVAADDPEERDRVGRIVQEIRPEIELVKAGLNLSEIIAALEPVPDAAILIGKGRGGPLGKVAVVKELEASELPFREVEGPYEDEKIRGILRDLEGESPVFAGLEEGSDLEGGPALAEKRRAEAVAAEVVAGKLQEKLRSAIVQARDPLLLLESGLEEERVLREAARYSL